MRIILTTAVLVGLVGCGAEERPEHLDSQTAWDPAELNLTEAENVDRDAPYSFMDPEASVQNDVQMMPTMSTGEALPLNESLFQDETMRRYLSLLRANDRQSLMKVIAELRQLGEDAGYAPQIAEAMFQLGQNYMFDDSMTRRDRMPEALRLFNKALEYNPDHVRANYQRQSILDIYDVMGIDPNERLAELE